MRMSSLTNGKTPDHYKRRANPLYGPFSSIFVKIFKTNPTTEPEHLAFYVPRPFELDDSFYRFMGVSNAAQCPSAGEYEADLSHFLSDHRNGEVLLVIGRIGSGKSTILRNFEYLCRKHKASNVQFITVNFNKKRAEFEQILLSQGAESLRREVVRYLVSEVTTKIAVRMTVEHQGAFWRRVWLSEPWFSKYRAVLKAHSIHNDEDKDWISSRQREFIESGDYVVSLLRFAKEILQIELVLVCDNVDPLPKEACESILWMSESFSGSHACRVVVSMRQSTYSALRNKIDALTHIKIEVEPVQFLEMVSRRAQTLKSEIQHVMNSDPSVIRSLGRDGLGQSDATELLESMVSVVLTKEVLDEIELLSNRNRRLGLEILLGYFESSYIHVDSIVGKLYGKARNGITVESEIPTHVIIQSAVTRNYETYFRSVGQVQSIFNFWYDPALPAPLCYFVPSLLLRRMLKNDSMHDYRVESLEEELVSIFEHTVYAGKLRASVRASIDRLVRHLTIESPDVLVIDRGTRTPSNAGLAITDLGKYYVNTLAYKLEYFSYVKDSIDFLGATVSRSPCASSIDDGRFSSRLEESCRMVEWLAEQEIALLHILCDNRSSLVKYKNFAFSEDVCLLITSGFLQSLGNVRFSLQTRLSQSAVNRYGVMKQVIDRAQNDFDKIMKE
jgi:energy-coupling factor transporter ATP-binding protein EcfA2